MSPQPFLVFSVLGGARAAWVSVLALALTGPAGAVPQPLRVDIEVRHILDTGSGGSSIRIARDPTDGALYYLRKSGSVYRLTVGAGSSSTSARIYQASDTGMSTPTGFAFGPEGAIYIVGNTSDGNRNVATVRVGIRTAPGADPRVWSTVVRTEPYPKSNTAFDHTWNGILVSADGTHLYLSSGSRTDHGEVQSNSGAFPGLREAPLTASMFRIPVTARDVLLEDDEEFLAASGFRFARGLRNSFDPALSPEGEIFSGDNSGDRDDSDELNWIREGRHYGFPWRMGTSDTPQRIPGYDPEADKLVDHDFYAYQGGFFHDDPGYPPPPAGEFTDPVLNFGPDADSFRDPVTGSILDGETTGEPTATFTAHRSPLGLVFDRQGALSDEFRGHAFVLGWTRGDATGTTVNGPFNDPGQDLLHLELTKVGEAYQVLTRRIVGGFLNPIDAEIIENRIYVLDYGGDGAIWEVTLPPALPGPRLRRGFINEDDVSDLSDGVAILFFLFLGDGIGCVDAADTNDNGEVDITDAIYWLTYLFLGGPAPVEPYLVCGPDETPDAGEELGCVSAAACP